MILLATCITFAASAQTKVFDHHVHLMSPRMIKLFKDVGIPFSKPDQDYSDWNAITKRLGTSRMNLISMAYLYGHPEFGKVENEYELVVAENDFLMAAKTNSPKSVRAYCGINPLKEYALKEVRRCGESLRADGIKLHFNASQVYLTVPEHVAKVLPVFEYTAKNKLPVLLHFDNAHRRFGEVDVKLLVSEILSKIGPIKLQIAHFGTSGGFNQRTKAVLDAFIVQIKSNNQLRKHRILFDISAVALDKDSEGVPKLTEEGFAELAAHIRKLGLSRISFGTDYPLYSVSEYLDILRNRVKLKQNEINRILKNK